MKKANQRGIVVAILLAGAGVGVWGGPRLTRWLHEAPARKLHARGEELYSAGKTEEALEAWQTATEKVPRWIPPYFRMAETLMELGIKDAAVQVLLRAQDADPNATHLLCRLGEAYALAEYPVEAKETAAQAVAREPKCFRSHAAYALAYREDSKAVLEHLRLAHQLVPQDPEILLRLARAQANNGAMGEAEKSLDGLAALIPESVETHYLRGMVLAARPSDREAVRQAEEHLAKALGLAPDRWDIHAQIGILHARQRRWRQARAALEKAYGLNPQSPAVLYQLGKVYRQLGDPRAPEIWDRLQTLQAATTRWQQLVREVAQHPDDRVRLLDAAELSLQLGSYAVAGRLAGQLLELDAGNKKARRVLEQSQQPTAPASGFD